MIRSATVLVSVLLVHAPIFLNQLEKLDRSALQLSLIAVYTALDSSHLLAVP